MKRSGQTDLPLHYGRVPAWLYNRMAKLGGAIVETIVQEYGKSEFLIRISDPFWFQSFGAVLGMDWHSSGITTSVMGALKQAINPMSNELGLFICGGRGKHSRQTPIELINIADKTGLNGNDLVKCSKLTAKIDNTAIQDGFQLYLHSFILTIDGEWSVIQQGMNEQNHMARRYHWHSTNIKSFVKEPHTSVVGKNHGLILNLTAKEAAPTQNAIIDISKERPDSTIREIQKLIMPRHHDIQLNDIDLKRLGSILALAYDRKFNKFEEFMLLEGLGPKTLRSLTLVSEVIHGTPSRFKDPARFAFAQGGKDGIPFPVQTKPYDETIHFLKDAVNKAKLGLTDKQKATKKLVDILKNIEQDFIPNPAHFNNYIAKEIKESPDYGGRTVFDKRKKKPDDNNQLKLFK